MDRGAGHVTGHFGDRPLGGGLFFRDTAFGGLGFFGEPSCSFILQFGSSLGDGLGRVAVNALGFRRRIGVGLLQCRQHGFGFLAKRFRFSKVILDPLLA